MKIHLIAIGGAVMHNLAIALQNAGHEVSGSDDEIYNPARDRLAKAGLLPAQSGWSPEKLTKDLDLVILGMHARADNPELLAAQQIGLKVMSYPEFIFEHSKNKKRVVVAGSHGKTTTVAMIMHCLRRQNLDFDYVVGAAVDGFENTVRLSDAPIIVIEGDEYSASPLDLRPKMVVYRPHLAVLTGIAWDHINVYPTFEKYEQQFEQLLAAIEPEGSLVWFRADAVIQKLIENTKHLAQFYSVPYSALPAKTKNGKMTLHLRGLPNLPLHIFGQHNLANAAAALLICQLLGVKTHDFLVDLAQFKGAARRLQIILENNWGTVWQDFAHAPSKVQATVEAVRQLYPKHFLVAAFELHTFSSLNKNFLPLYRNTLALADRAFVFYSPHTLSMKKLPELNPADIADAFDSKNVEVFTSRADLELRLANLALPKFRNLLLMSSGTFDGMDFLDVATRFLKNSSTQV